MTRYPRTAGLGLVLAALALGLAAQSLSAGSKLNPVSVQATAGKPDDGGKQTITVQIKIDKGWHIYANPVKHEDLTSAQTTVTVKAGGKALPAKVMYPAGTAHTDKLVGTFNIYEDQVTIKAEVLRPSGETGPMEVNVKYQACDAKQCLTPKTVKIELK
jgi:DsbC/DsbD-like thiol-disulfide interchange protein